VAEIASISVRYVPPLAAAPVLAPVLADGPEGLLLLHATATRLRTAATAKTRRYGFFTRLPLFPGSGNPVRCCWLPALLSILSVTRSSIASRVQCVPQPVAQQVERERQEQQEH